MKKMMLVLLITATICEVSMAGSESKMAVVRHGDIFKVFYKSPYLSCVKVSIADNNGNQIFTEELICNQGFTRPYNFSELPKGDYTIQLTDGTDQKLEKVHFDDKPWLAQVKQLRTEDKRVMVAIPHQQETSDFTIQILDDQNQVIYKEDQKTDSDYAQVFKLVNLRGATLNVFNRSTGQAKSIAIE